MELKPPSRIRAAPVDIHASARFCNPWHDVEVRREPQRVTKVLELEFILHLVQTVSRTGLITENQTQLYLHLVCRCGILGL